MILLLFATVPVAPVTGATLAVPTALGRILFVLIETRTSVVLSEVSREVAVGAESRSQLVLSENRSVATTDTST